jgi:hypothetical protein
MFGPCFLCRLRIPVRPFPVCSACPSRSTLSGSDALTVLGPPFRSGLPVARTPGTVRASHVLDASLHAYHALQWTPTDPRRSHQIDLSVLASGALQPSPSALLPLTGLYQASGSAVSLTVYVVPCVRFTRVVRLAPPSQAQHSVCVVGETLLSRDFHPARNAKLRLAH